MKYKPGDKVYRVVDNLLAEFDGSIGVQPQWCVESRTIAKVAPKTVVLDRPFTGTMSTFGYIALSAAPRLFHASKAEAFAAFAKQMQRNADTARRELARAEAACAWAASNQRSLTWAADRVIYRVSYVEDSELHQHSVLVFGHSTATAAPPRSTFGDLVGRAPDEITISKGDEVSPILDAIGRTIAWPISKPLPEWAVIK